MEQELFANRYILLEQKGRGSFGEVWLARDSQLDMEVAIKIYIALDDRGIEEFKKEYKTAYNLNHPNLLHAYHFDVCERRPFLVMPYCPSSALSLIGECDPDTLWQFIGDVASGLAYLHKMDVVHHDIKPDNILRTESGSFVITDFGISTKMRSTLRRNSSRSVQQNSSGGSLPYMGPEMFSERAESVKATDIWAFGVTLYEMITGNLPFFGQGGIMLRNGAAIPDIPYPDPEIVKLVKACLAKETWDRPTAEAIAAMAKRRAFSPVPPEPDPEKPDPVKPSPKKRPGTVPEEPRPGKSGGNKPRERSTVPIAGGGGTQPQPGPTPGPVPEPEGKRKSWFAVNKWIYPLLGLLAVCFFVTRSPERRVAKKNYPSYLRSVNSVRNDMSELIYSVNPNSYLNRPSGFEQYETFKDIIDSLYTIETRYRVYYKDYNKVEILRRDLSAIAERGFNKEVAEAENTKYNDEAALHFSRALYLKEDETVRKQFDEAVEKVSGINMVTNVYLYHGDREDEVEYEFKDGEWVITSENKSIPASKTDYLAAYLEITGFRGVTNPEAYNNQTFSIKIIRPDGSISKGNSSPSGYSFKDSGSFLTEYNEDCNKYWISGWGNEQKTCYSRGRYKYEVYSKGRKLFSIPVTFR